MALYFSYTKDALSWFSGSGEDCENVESLQTEGPMTDNR